MTVDVQQSLRAEVAHDVVRNVDDAVIRVTKSAFGSAEQEVLIRWVELNYGSELAAGVARRLGVVR